jgi:hypothetical protein
LRSRDSTPSSASSLQKAAKRCPIGVFKAEGACDFAGANLSRLRANEGDDLVARGKTGSLAVALDHYPLALPAVFFAAGRGDFAAVFGLATGVPRALAADFFAASLLDLAFVATFLAGFAAGSAALAFFLAGARFVLPPLPARALIRSMACSSVTVSGVMSPVSVALVPSCETYGAIATVLQRDDAAAGVIAERLAGVGAEPAAARTLGDFLRDQRDRAIEADGENIVAGFKAGIGLAVRTNGPNRPIPAVIGSPSSGCGRLRAVATAA